MSAEMDGEGWCGRRDWRWMERDSVRRRTSAGGREKASLFDEEGDDEADGEDEEEDPGGGEEEDVPEAAEEFVELLRGGRVMLRLRVWRARKGERRGEFR
jgi:hypothetical protein